MTAENSNCFEFQKPRAMESSDDSPTPNKVEASVNPDDLSLLTETSNTSTLHWAGGVLSKAAQILRGEGPGTPPRSPTPEEVTTNGVDDGYVFDDAQEEPKGELFISAAPDKEEEEEEPVIDFLKDDPKDMTYGRRIALHLMKYAWYNPALKAEHPEIAHTESQLQRKEEQNGLLDNDAQIEDESIPTTPKQIPSLSRAWAYFEHVTLPRYVAKPKEGPRKSLPRRCIRKFCKGNDVKLDRAEPGEKHLYTRLYSPISTPLSQMGDFGLGIGLYFSSLRAITILTLLAGLINIPNLIYYSGDDYSDSQPGVSWLIQGSAICTRNVWVPCPDCSADDFESNRIGTANVLDDGENVTLTFALHNDCEGATLQQGFINYGTMFFIIIGIYVMTAFQKRMEVKFDEDEQTAQDYSIIVENPPPDATDPEEWRQFFQEKFRAHVTTCTVAVDNDLLVRSLVERRELLRKLEISLPPGTPVDNFQRLAGIAAKLERERKGLKKFMAIFVGGIPEIVARLAVLTAKVQGLAQLDYPATNIFITFETEKAQREVLSALSVGSLTAKRNRTSALSDPAYLFRGMQVLKVSEPDEPSNVRWQDLNVKFIEMIKPLITTTLATLASIVLIAFIVAIINDFRNAWAAFAIAIGNSVFPIVAKLLTNLEAHKSEGAKQTSLYFKIALFRWTNTAIVLTIITPFTATLEDHGGVIEGIAAIFFAEIITTNVIQLADPMGHIQRHILAPRAITQDMMYLNMRGQVFELAERYTNMTKILFLCLWYCSIYPATFFLCSFALFINYFSDRFSLMRTWARTPKLGTRIASFSRKFFSLAIIAMAVVSAYAWSGFPYDNLCINNESAGDLYAQVSDIIEGNGNTANFTLSRIDLDSTYRYCLQDLLRTQGRSFPAVPKFQPEGEEWMTEDQETLTSVYGWSSVGIMALMLVGFVWGLLSMLRGLFRSTYSPSGDDMNVNFSDVPSIDAYIPQVHSPLFAYPLIACNSDNIDDDLYDWANPDQPHSYYDITKDADRLLDGINMSAKHVFSVLAHWPPSKIEKEKSTRMMSNGFSTHTPPN